MAERRRMPKPAWSLELQQQQFAQRLKEAKAINAQRDQDERAMGLTAASDCGVWQYLRTAMTALEAGINRADLSCLMEAYAMLDDIEQQIRPPDFRSERR
jgi:hypothetical protein